jgi:hypothetical protein
VIHEKLPPRIEVRARLEAHVRASAEPPDARVEKILMLERFPVRWNIAGVGEVVGAFCG